MEKIPCSVPILTLNSGKHLARCLASVKDFDDVYLVDGNSTDDTLTIAKRFGALVYKQFDTDEPNVRITNFTEMRNKAAGFMKCDWYWQLDSDEYVPLELVAEIREFFARQPDKYTAANVGKKYIIGEKKIHYAFNYPNYWVRLYHRDSGIGFKPGKIVHEQLYVPSNIKIVNFKQAVWMSIPETYRTLVAKDRSQLVLMRQVTFASGRGQSRWHSLRLAILYWLRAVKIILKSLLIYLWHGYRNSLPLAYVWRHARTHLLISAWRLRLFVF